MTKSAKIAIILAAIAVFGVLLAGGVLFVVTES